MTGKPVIPPDPGDDGVIGACNDKRIPCHDIVGGMPGCARELRHFGGDAEQGQCHA